MKAWHCIATVPAFFIRRPDDGQTTKYVSVRAYFADLIASYSRKQGFDGALQAMYSRKQGFDDALQAMYSRKQGFDDALQAMYSRKQGFDDAMQAMYSRKKGFAGDIPPCIVENKASTAMLLHRTSRKRKSGRVVTTPPLRTFKNLTNYFFSLNISWQAFQS